MKKQLEKVKNSLKPKNISQKIIEMPTMNKVYWSKILLAILSGIIFGLSNFRNWPAVLTMFAIFLLSSLAWFLIMREKEPGIKVRSYFTSAMFQFFITMIALWTIIQNTMYVPPSDWTYPFI